jgi:hypothetical protein
MRKSSHSQISLKGIAPEHWEYPHSKPENYTPFFRGLYDEAPALDEAVKKAAAENLKSAEKNTAELFATLDKITEAYWWAWHASVRPKEHWHASQIDPVWKAAQRLQRAIAELPSSTRSLLKARIERRSLGPDSDALLEHSLAAMIAACAGIERNGQPGRPPKSAIIAAVKKLMDVWSAYSGKKFPITLLRTKVRKSDQAVGLLGSDVETEEAFWSTAAQFVFEVMQGIDPRITSSEVVTAIRRSAAPQRGEVQKTR